MSQLAHEYRANFGDFSLTELGAMLDDLGKAGTDTDRKYMSTYLAAVPVPSNESDPILHPLVKFGARRYGAELDICLRVAVYYEHEGELYADGWRFEMADTDDTGTDHHHHFPHVQSISGWEPFRRGSHGFHYEYVAHSDGHTGLDARLMNESRPAVPLACRTPTGLIVATMAALYGARRTSQILEPYSNKPASLVDELSVGLGWTTW
ncbi:hypothetical protein [Streptomyces sp. AC495_CC817]|uniref:hypothetical protein n=1 Tax=Streptomyces sp. AC495_CC817 TaxID=2823900 RepID=UPI001C264944|nr:hypothetical protein [Streptomyces sp. AC495_CC817]